MAQPLREVMAGADSERTGPIPKLLLPGDGQLMSPFIEDLADLIVESHEKHPERTPHLYRRDIVPVFPMASILGSQTKRLSKLAKTHARRFIEMKAEYFLSWVDRHCAPYKVRHDRAGNPFDVVKPMPKEVARACLESHDFTMKLPPIERTYPTPMPVIEEDGELTLCRPGYNPESGTYVFPADWDARKDYFAEGDGMVSSHGIYDDTLSLRDAINRLHALYQRFPFSDWSAPFIPTEESPFYDPENPDGEIRLSRSLSVQIMAMLAVFAGGCVPSQASRLGFIANANKQRSGKTLLIKMITTPIYGQFKAQSWRDEEENMLKVLDSETLAGGTYICFDNVRGLIASQPLEGFMTTPAWTGRILGRSEMFTAENHVNVFLTGNNASVGADMQERLLFIDLYVETADRQDRETELTPEEEIDDVWLAKAENRRDILSALWAIVRHWDAAGRPAATGSPRRGFSTWCRILAGMVEFAGFGDALERPVLENAGDSETDDIAALVRILSDGVRARQCTFQEIVHTCWEKGLFPWLMHGREEYVEDIEKNSLRLNDPCKSKFGLLLQRNCSGTRGEVHVIRATGQPERRIKFYCRGKGRGRRFHFDELKTTRP
jgi:hypothetical protein